MEKNFSAWMQVKKDINDKLPRPIGFRERDIWVCSIGENVGFETDGKGAQFVRPVLIMKTYGKRLCHIIPLSTTARRDDKFYYPFDGRTGKISVALLSQSRIVDCARLHRKIGKATEKDFEEITARLQSLFAL